MKADGVIRLLTENKKTLGCAESLTGGLLCDAFVQVPGASRVFMGGIVAYDEGRKEKLLGVQHGTLEKYTAVSAQTAKEMAEGARHALNVDFALSTTGYAGPDGDDVGLVYVGYADENAVEAVECRFEGSRAEIRNQAVDAAVNLIRQHLKTED